MTARPPAHPAGDVLIVDDEDAITYAMRRYLRAAGYRVDIAATHREAQELLARCRYELLIVDLRLAPGDGLQGLELLAFARRANPRTKLVVLTAYGSPAIEEEARTLGACSFLHKPQPLADIARLVGELLEPAPA
jgi:DNA-binding NtrC family response regulator